MENNKWYIIVGIIIFGFIVIEGINRLEKKIDFVWQDNGNDIDELMKKVEELESKIDEIQSKLGI